MNNQTKKCSECGSLFYINSSKMNSLCPECSFYLYGHENCKHEFVNGRCKKCYWDGSSSGYIERLKNEKEKK